MACTNYVKLSKEHVLKMLARDTFGFNVGCAKVQI